MKYISVATFFSDIYNTHNNIKNVIFYISLEYYILRFVSAVMGPGSDLLV